MNEYIIFISGHEVDIAGAKFTVQTYMFGKPDKKKIIKHINASGLVSLIIDETREGYSPDFGDGYEIITNVRLDVETKSFCCLRELGIYDALKTIVDRGNRIGLVNAYLSEYRRKLNDLEKNLAHSGIIRINGD